MEDKHDDIEIVAKPEEGNAIEKDIDEVIDMAFVVDGDKIVSAKDLVHLGDVSPAAHSRGRDSVKIKKDMPDGSTQQEGGGVDTDIFNLLGRDIPIKDPPYDIITLSGYLQREETHARCCQTKVEDAIGRGYSINPTEELLASQALLDPEIKKKVDKEREIVKTFIRNANRDLGFKAVIKLVGLDRESVGFGALEVIRGRDMKVKRVAHIPAWRIRPLAGWRGFIETDGEEMTYYQNWGDKVVVDDLSEPDGWRPYDPFIDKHEPHWNFIDRKTGERTNNFNRSANEVIWFPKVHPSTVYFGLPDIIPAMGSVLGNIYIETYGLQFFENNAIPHYAIVVEGAKFSPEVLNLIQTYFRKQIKGRSHSTLIIPVPNAGKQVKVRFEKLSAEQKEASFQEYRKRNQQAIMTAHGVSPAIIGIAETANLGSGKGRAQTENYRDRIIEPNQEYYEEKLNDLFVKGLWVTNVVLKFDPYNIQDNIDLINVLTKHEQEGNLSVNEVRALAKIGPPIPGGDKHYKKVGRVLYCIETGEILGDAAPTKPSPDRIDENLNPKTSKSPPCRMSGETIDECVERKIPEIAGEHPDWTHEHVIGAAYGMCERSCADEDGKSERDIETGDREVSGSDGCRDCGDFM